MRSFIARLLNPTPPPEQKKRERATFFTTDQAIPYPYESRDGIMERAYSQTFQKQLKLNEGVAMDEKLQATMDGLFGIKAQFAQNTTVPNNLISWYASQSFLGYPVCAMMAQQWLVSKACWVPADDAVRKGYNVTVNDGSEIEPEILDYMRSCDREYKIPNNMSEFIGLGRVFGIRIAMFIIETKDAKNFYANPFNPDGIPPNSYKGISQIDPYWITPQLDNAAAGDPGSIDFYEPTWWYINGLMVHKSHLIIFRNEELPDILKPTYMYGSVSLPQKIYERVYAAERTANEAPMLAMTKRLDILKTDATKALANQDKFAARVQAFSQWRNNLGIKVIDSQDEDMVQFDTSLSDLDNVIMTQYQLVAAVANVPATKLIGTQPKGFNSSGEYEEASYHEFLQTLQEKVRCLVERHHLILMYSNVVPKFNIAPVVTTIRWNELDAMTEKEQAEVNKLKADTATSLSMIGAIDGEDERNRIIADPNSGYTGIDAAVPEQPEQEPNEEPAEDK